MYYYLNVHFQGQSVNCLDIYIGSQSISHHPYPIVINGFH